MRRVLATAALLAATVAALLALPTASFAATSESSKTVVLVLAPYLAWSDITPTSTPTLWSLAEKGALGAVNTRSRARESGAKGSPLDTAFSVSAGSWAVQNFSAPAAYSVKEAYEVGSAAEAYTRTTGNSVSENRIVFLGLPMTQRLNDERSYKASLGILGQSIEDQGGMTAAVGNSDVGYSTGERRWVRPAALAAMDRRGLVSLGDVSARLLKENPYAPFGIETDIKRVDAALTQMEEGLAKQGGPALVVVDSGDLYRSMKFRPQVTEQIYQQHRQRALSTLDEITALTTSHLRDATVIVMSLGTGDPEQGDPEGLAPLIISGGGYSGYLASDSTQRDGLVTALDVTAAVLNILEMKVPVDVVGSDIGSRDSAQSTEERIARLDSMNNTAIAVDSVKRSVVNLFVGFIVVVLALSAFVLVRAGYWQPRFRAIWVTLLKGALLLALSVPIASWLMFALNAWPQSTAQAVTTFVMATLAVWALALLVWWRTPMRVPVGVMSLLTVFVVLADQWFGAPASFTNFFGYSPLLAARFYGIGNEAAAIVFGAAVVGVAVLFDEWSESPKTRFAKRFALPLLGVAVIATTAAPFLGANIGVAIWGVVGFGLAIVLMNGRHVSWRLVFWLFLAVAIVIGAFAAIDLFGSGQQTHLGRALASTEQGGLQSFWTLIVRKAETNARVLTHTNWAYILIATLGFLGLMRWRPQGDFADTLVHNPDFADAITVSLVAGLVAYFTEDSGIVIPALEVFYVGVALSWLMLSRLDLDGSASVRRPRRNVESESER